MHVENVLPRTHALGQGLHLVIFVRGWPTWSYQMMYVHLRTIIEEKFMMIPPGKECNICNTYFISSTHGWTLDICYNQQFLQESCLVKGERFWSECALVLHLLTPLLDITYSFTQVMKPRHLEVKFGYYISSGPFKLKFHFRNKMQSAGPSHWTRSHSFSQVYHLEIQNDLKLRIELGSDSISSECGGRSEMRTSE